MNNRISNLFFIVLFTTIFLKCNGGTDYVCDPGETQPCVCSGGAPGGQTCNEDRMGWGECQCLPPEDTSEQEDILVDDGIDDIQEFAEVEVEDIVFEEILSNPCEGTDYTTYLCFVPIPPGTFTMGSPDTEYGRETHEYLHEVTLSHGFEMSATEVTYGQWARYMADTRWERFDQDIGMEPLGFSAALWFCNVLSEWEGLPTCYDLFGCGYDTVCTATCWLTALNYPTPYDCPGYRLPTEAEWEYAIRAGTGTAFYSGDVVLPRVIPDPNLDLIAWYDENAEETLHPVAQKEPNAWFLYDMSGNILEWTYDRYVEDLRTLDPTNPWVDPIPIDPLHIVARGGSISRSLEQCRSAWRMEKTTPGCGGMGFRVVKTIF